MADLVVRAVMTADQSGLVSGANEASTALDRMKSAHTDLSAAAKEAANDIDHAGLSTYQFSRALSELGTPMGARVLGMRELLRGSHELIEGLGLLETGALALGVAFAAELSHTVLFQNALHSLWGTLEEGITWFDKLVSGKQRWDAAQAEGVVKKYETGGDLQTLLSDRDTLSRAMNDSETSSVSLRGLHSPSEMAAAAGRLPLLSGAAAGNADRQNALHEINRRIDEQLHPLHVSGNPLANAGDAQSQQARENALANNYFLPGYEVNNMARDPSTGMWVGSNNLPGYQGHAAQWTNAANQRALGTIPAVSTMMPWNTPNEQGWASVGANGATMGGTSQQVNDARAMTEQMQKLWDDYDAKQAQALQQSLDKMKQEEIGTVDEIRSSFDQLGMSISTNFKSAGQDVENLVMKLAQMAVQVEVMQPMTSALFGAQGTPGGGLIGGAISNFLGLGVAGSIPDSIAITPNMVTGAYHTGGVIGVDGMSRFIHPAWWDNAARMHSGGIAGNEVPIIAQKGEGVFTPAQMQALGARASPNVNLTIHNSTGANARVQQNTDANGNLDLTVMMDQIDYTMADYTQRGKSQMARMLESTYGLQRQPGM